MRKVISIVDKEPLKELPLQPALATELLEHVLKYKIDSTTIDPDDRWMLWAVVNFIEKNSGVSAMEIMERNENEKVS